MPEPHLTNLDPSTPPGRAPIGVLIAWTLAVCVAVGAQLAYYARPGRQAQAPRHWPAASALPRPAEHPRLLVFLHPRCPCSRATLTELERVQAATRGRLDIAMVISQPAGSPPDWLSGSIVSRARALPGALVEIDQGDREASRFGVHTSGQVLLYEESGRLLYRGGLTAGRDHEGDNDGMDAVLAHTAGHAAPATCSVYGCGIGGPAANPVRVGVTR